MCGLEKKYGQVFGHTNQTMDNFTNVFHDFFASFAAMVAIECVFSRSDCCFFSAVTNIRLRGGGEDH